MRKTRPVHITITAPAEWASYLVNGDASGLSVEEKEQADAWLKRERVAVVGTLDDAEPRFTHHMKVYAPEVTYQSGAVLEYVAISIDETDLTLEQWAQFYNVTIHRSDVGYPIRVFQNDIPAEARWDLHHLSDYVVSARISGPAFALSPRS